MQLLPRAPTINLPAVIPNNTSPPVPTTILPTAAPPAPQGMTFSSIHLEQYSFIALQGCQMFRISPQQSSEPALLREVLTKSEMVLDQQSTILRLLQLQEDQGQLLDIEEGLLPLQNLPQLLSLEQKMLQSPKLVRLFPSFFSFFFNNCLHNCTATNFFFFQTDTHKLGL
ncbi:Anoctamin-8 [Labeo rohita]|uniref:Anoctamin-8 n=1 Tax=Labeo rohita TaxID=84645 RepID=A0ABQ8L996_LABRO|nr:Anoctamin-8 [Labeo rohita]